MIKNILIFILAMAVIGMYFLIPFKNSRDIENRLVTEFNSTINSFKQEILNAKNLAINNKKLSDNNDISKQINSKKIEEEITDFKTSVNDIPPDESLIKEKNVERIPAELTVANKIKQDSDENISKEDLDQIMSILNSAEDVLHKTSFEFKRINKPNPATKSQNKVDSEVKIIKKKSFSGQKELG